MLGNLGALYMAGLFIAEGIKKGIRPSIVRRLRSTLRSIEVVYTGDCLKSLLLRPSYKFDRAHYFDLLIVMLSKFVIPL